MACSICIEQPQHSHIRDEHRVGYKMVSNKGNTTAWSGAENVASNEDTPRNINSIYTSANQTSEIIITVIVIVVVVIIISTCLIISIVIFIMIKLI